MMSDDEVCERLLDEKGEHASSNQRRTPTPLPKLQIAILLGIQLAEPISSSLIYPFINQMVQDLGVTGGDDKKIGYYAGLLESMFFLAEACCVYSWGKMSDRIGRRPVLVIGTLGQAVSALIFGLSARKSFWAALAARAFAGATNGNIGVVKTVMGELTDETNIAQGFALMPIVWSAGATLGPLLGGTLSRPHERFGGPFNSAFWKEFPYLLPCLVAASFSTFMLLLGIVFLVETKPGRKTRAIRGKEYFEVSEAPDTPTESSPPDVEQTLLPPPSLWSIIRGPMGVIVINYTIFALSDISYNVLQPVIFGAPVAARGVGMSPRTIGITLGLNGLLNGIVQSRLFPTALARVGAKGLFTSGAVALMLAYALYPALQSLAALSGGANLGVWIVVALQIILQMAISSAYGCVNIFMVSVASPAALGATNGIVQTTVSVARAIGPAVSTSLYALSVQQNILGGYFVFLLLGALAALCIWSSSLLPSLSRLRSKSAEGGR